MDFFGMINSCHDAARKALLDLPDKDRGRLSAIGPWQQTHFYRWLRGDNSALSAELIDQILLAAGLHFRDEIKITCWHGKGFARTGNFVNWHLADWDLTNGELGRLYGVTTHTAGKARFRHTGKNSHCVR